MVVVLPPEVPTKNASWTICDSSIIKRVSWQQRYVRLGFLSTRRGVLQVVVVYELGNATLDVGSCCLINWQASCYYYVQ